MNVKTPPSRHSVTLPFRVAATLGRSDQLETPTLATARCASPQ